MVSVATKRYAGELLASSTVFMGRMLEVNNNKKLVSEVY